MGTLNYRKAEDANREFKKRKRMKLFGLSQADVWEALAEELGATFQNGKWWPGQRVVANVPPWQVVLDVYHAGKQQFTRMRAPYVNADGFRFEVFRRHLFSPMAKWMGMQDVEVGFKDFDEAFIIRGNNEAQLKRLFASSTMRELLDAQPRIRFQVTGDGRIFRKQFPDGVDQVQFLQLGIVKDLEQLKSMYQLFAKTLHRLCAIGSAYEDDPKVKI
jgi:hypothetical protein